jgi:hypothetical protein
MTGNCGVPVGVTLGLAVPVGVQQESPIVAVGVLCAVAVRLGAGAVGVAIAGGAVRVALANTVGVAMAGLPSSSPSPHPTASESSIISDAAVR